GNGGGDAPAATPARELIGGRHQAAYAEHEHGQHESGDEDEIAAAWRLVTLRLNRLPLGGTRMRLEIRYPRRRRFGRRLRAGAEDANPVRRHDRGARDAAVSGGDPDLVDLRTGLH